VREKDSGILQNVRPSAVDVRGQQPELFPFDAFLYTTGRQGEKRTLTLKEGWEFLVKGRIETSEGVIAGWQITATYLKSPTDAIRLDSQARRVEVRDSGGSPMIALGYLGGIGSYQPTEYGLYVAPTVKFEVGSGGAFKGGDYVVTDSAAFSIKSGAQEVVRLGSLGSGYYGIVVGTSGNHLRFSTEDGSLTVSGTITASSGNIGGWSITSQGLQGTNASLLSAGELVLGSSNEIVKLSSQDSTYRLWIGSTDPALAPFRVTKEGSVRAVAGVVGGWILSTTMLKSADSGARIELNQDKKRISVFDAYNETVAMGYLEGLPKREGSGYWGAGDYGFWAKQGDRLRIDGDVEYIKGDWLIQNDASYLIKDSQDRVIVRMGTDTGEKGFYLYDPATSTLQIRLGTKGAEKGLYVLENNTGLNYRAKLDTSGFFVGDDLNYVWYDRASSSLTMKVTSFLVSSLGTEIKGLVQISDEGTLGGGLTNPLKLYTSGGGSAKVGVIEQVSGILFKINGIEQLRIKQSRTIAVGDRDVIKIAEDGAASVIHYTIKEEDWGAESVVNNSETGINRMVLLHDNRILAIYRKVGVFALFQRIRDNNGNWSDETIIVNGASGLAGLAVLPDGRVLLIYFKPQDQDTYEKIRNLDGSWGSETTIPVDVGVCSFANLSDGSVLCVYSKRSNSKLAQRIRSSNGSWGPEVIVNDYTTHWPCLIKLDDGRIVCIYVDDSNGTIRERVRDINGSWGSETVITFSTYETYPHAVLTPDKRIFLVYAKDYSSSSSVYLVRRIRGTDGSWGGEVQITPTRRIYGSLVVTHDGKILLTYTSLAQNQYLCQKILNYSTTSFYQLGAGIIEVGSNSNGTWIKFSDGTMIAYGKGSHNITGWSSQTASFGLIYWVGVPGFNFGVTFYNTPPVVHVSLYQTIYASDLFQIVCTSHGVTVSGIGNHYITSWSSQSPPPTGTIYYNWTAIGRWK